MMERSLAFRLLDHHVVTGRADEPAVLSPSGTLTYATLLHDSACLAAGLTHVGLPSGGSATLVEAPATIHVVSLLACVRLGVLTVPDADVRLGGEPARVVGPDIDEDWHVVLRAGRVDPAPAPAVDPDDYAERMLAEHPAILGALLEGRYFTPQA